MCTRVLCRVDTQGDTHTTTQVHDYMHPMLHRDAGQLGEVGSVWA